jgi:hypothetical protein
MSYQKDRDEFLTIMAGEGCRNLETLRAILRHAATLQRLAETACNRTLTKWEERTDENETRAMELCLPEGFSAVFSGDPRGAVVKIKVPSGRTNDWGQQGICVPTR